MINLANSLTLGRILTVPVLVALLYFPSKITMFLAALLFFLASLTDIFDGMIARRQNQVTTLGKFLDPLADKLLISSILIMLTQLGYVDAWITVVIICRELIITGLRAIAMDMGLVLAADNFGKMKTIAQSLALGPLLLHYPYFGIDMHALGTQILYVALGLTVFSAGNYMYNLHKIWLTNE
ncbi:CDP-diacylglycerol--glycerol-3-phosphate 3-phosphatidyltransferase [Maridesulfovibrio ferrireducens]|uniref:CDP-diacylglycerol--glycerol-3-phosphate 3-phosphatidyltransferase n=1 Tax=Maridesulfovibrio ferrireducens TaxID=246191 RepID=A0A1G9LMB8_9BACT|nr:CDP-diacylglycerol--glycerol-3-phosphate 3-phosphatidyltransferase [Maridesulfovibrio ferrireducens]SDL62993.1 CDP-diacylglycerol--glycerol-3-phosphate 3-phosphatidyltransferase [Maridesulfovibrio ferrireducens]